MIPSYFAAALPLVVATMSDCSICLQSLQESENASLACGHTFHAVCLQTLGEVRGAMQHELACPLCKMTAAQVHGRQVVDVEDDEWEIPLSHLRPPAPSPSALEAAAAASAGDPAESAGTASAEAASTASPKAKAKAKAQAKASTAASTGDPAADAAAAAPHATAKAKAKAKAKSAATAASTGDPAAEAAAAPYAKAKAKAKAKGRLREGDPVAEAEAAAAAAPHEAKATAKKRKADPAAEVEPTSKRRCKTEKSKEVQKAEAEEAENAKEAAENAATEKPPEVEKAAHAADMSEINVKLAASMQFNGEVQCSTCGQFSDFKRCRIASKGKGTWKCGTCNARSVQLWRHFGSWPIPAFSSLSEAEKMAFMASLGSGSAQDAIDKAEELQTYANDEEQFQEGGHFLPIKVWEKQGYDGESIKLLSRPSDVDEHPVLGTTYRLRLKSVVNNKVRGTRRASSAKVTPQAASSAGASAAAADLPAADDISSSQSSATSSSTSSSSSSSYKKKKDKKKKKKAKKAHSKKTKKEKKKKDKKEGKHRHETAAEQKKRQKEEERAMADNRKRAEQVINKTSGAITSMNALLGRSEMNVCPSMIKEPIDEALATLTSLKAKADETLESNGKSSVSEHDVKAR